ncbi:MAG: head GIN domain-containing protein [Cyclobacteriaceae bacterium]
MKNSLALIAVLFSFFAAVAQETDTRQVGAFSGVKVAEGIDVFLKKGDKELVKVEVMGTDPSNIITEISGDYLKIHRKDGRYAKVEAKVYVTYVKIDKLSASSAGSIFSDGTIQANFIEIGASSAGSIEVSIEAGTAEVSSSSAGDVELKGKVGSISANASSAGEIDAYDLRAEKVSAEASSGASVKVSVSESLQARASSGGSIRYQGNPDRSNTNSSSGGSVRKTN